MCEAPAASVQVTLTESPGEWAATALRSAAEVLDRGAVDRGDRVAGGDPGLGGRGAPVDALHAWCRSRPSPTPRNAG